MKDNEFKLLVSKNNNPDVHGTYKSEPKLYLNHDGCRIDEDTYVTVDEYTHYDHLYYLVTLHKKDKSVILGRYIKLHNNLMVSYKDGKILLYSVEFDYRSQTLTSIVKVFNLYNLEDDMSYVLTEKQALHLFDPTLNDKDLKTPDEYLVDYNIANNQKKKDKGLARFSYYGD